MAGSSFTLPEANNAGETVGDRMLLVAALLIFILVVTKHAWACDDAYITMRTVRNFVDGWGLRWNVHERVQGYTHPLWMFVLSAVFSVLRSPFATIIVTSLVVSALVAVKLTFRAGLRAQGALLALAILTSSKSFVDFSTSGLENPLCHLLYAYFFCAFFASEPVLASGRTDPWYRTRAFRLGLTAGLLATTRMDAVLLCVPALVWAAWQSRRETRQLWYLAAGFTPLAMWELFSLVYYGFLFPNTAYAKLAAGIPQRLLMEQGLLYFVSQLGHDPLALLVIVLAACLPVVCGARWLWAPAMGMILYMLFIVRVGGDFMAGRFFTLPLLAAAMVLGRLLGMWQPAKQSALSSALPAVIAFILGVVLTPRPTLAGSEEYMNASSPRGQAVDARGVADERWFYFSSSSLMRATRGGFLPDDDRRTRGINYKSGEVGALGMTGVTGYVAPTTTIIIDVHGLTDPLMARLPIPNSREWRIGHLVRNLPDGYLDSIREQRNVITDPAKAKLYDKLRLVTVAPIWRWDRVKQITRFAFGID
jgi:arabinofuranosyltransferase